MSKRVDAVKVFEDTGRDIFASLHKLHTKSENAKTGDMAGLYILPISDSPIDSVKAKTDNRQCGNCLFRAGAECYVQVWRLTALWKSIVKKLITALPDAIKKPVRLGVYGDPGFVPLPILQDIVKRAPGHTGYTHQWLQIHKAYSSVLMASIDELTAKREGLTGVKLKAKANSIGYRTFRIVNNSEEVLPDEVICPNYTHGIQCDSCKLCSGNTIQAKNVVIPIHGPPNKVKSYRNKVKDF